MATSITPIRSIPTVSGDISGSFTAGGTSIRMCGALTSAGQDNLVLIRQQPSGYWEKTSHELRLSRLSADFLDASGSVEVQIGSLDKFHVLSETGAAVSAGSVTLEDLSPATGVTLPSIPGGDTLALLAASQSLSSKTLVAPVISTGLTATGSASNDFSASTGTFKTSTGAVTIGGGSAAISATTSGGAITLTAGAASTWKTTSGALGVQGAGGVNVQYGSTTLIDVGVTNSAKVTLAANKSIAGAAGTGAVEFGSMTGDCALPTGAVSWAGASAKALSLVATGAAVTITAGAASTWSTTSGALTLTSAGAATWSTASGGLTITSAGAATWSTAAGGLTITSAAAATWSTAAGALTLTSAAAATWKTAAGALTVDSAAALNLGTTDSTSQSIGKSGTIATFNGKTAYGASAQVVADPGNAGAIPVTANGMCALTSAGAETRTLAIPTFAGQQLSIICDTYVGNIVVTSAQAINQTGNNTMTFGAAADAIFLVAMTVGGALRWRVMGNDGVALSTV